MIVCTCVLKIQHSLYSQTSNKDPQRKGYCMLNLSIRDTVSLWGPKNYHSLENLREENNLSIRDKTAEFILLPKFHLFGGSTVLFSDV